MTETINKLMTLEKLTDKLNVIKTLLSDEEPSYELKIESSYKPISLDMDVAIEALKVMEKKVSKSRKQLLKDFKNDVRNLK